MFGPYFGDHMGSDYFAAGPSTGIEIPGVVQVERQIARINVGGTTVGIVIIDRELADALSESGYDWSDYNHLRWPIGASRHASGKFLFHASGIETLRAADIHASPFTLEIGDSSSPIVVQNLMALPPESLYVSTRGARDGADAAESVRLYALPIVDTRLHSARAPATQNFNLLGADRETFNSETINGEDPFTYDEIGALLASSAGLSFNVASGSERSTHPFDLRIEGLSASLALDRLLAESGRVFVAGTDGTSTVEDIDKREASQVLTTIRERIITGGVRYATPTPIGGAFLNEITPVSSWSSQEVPGSVAVSMPTLGGTTPANDPAVKRIVAANNAATFSLDAGLEDVRDIPDSMPVLDPDEVSAAELARAELRAQEFYRRYVAGAMDIWLTGIIVPRLGGSCQELIWFFDNIRGARTRARADFDLDLYGDHQTKSEIMAGPGIQVVRRPGGDVETRLIDGVFVKVGKITEASVVVDSLPPDATYKAISEDGAWETTELARPLYRPYNDAPIITPAAVDSDCLIALIDDVVLLWSCDERIAFEICDPDEGTALNPTLDTASDEWVVGQLRTVQTSPSGNVVVKAGGGLSGNPENLVIVDPEGEPVSDPTFDLIIEFDIGVSSDFYDRITVDPEGEVVTGEDDEVVIEWDGVALSAPVPVP